MASSPRVHQRTVQAALFDGTIGPLTARELLGLPEDSWGHLRDLITDRRVADPERFAARCLWCNGGVYIKAQVVDGNRLPLFAHFCGQGEECPWHHKRPIRPDDARAAQYQGQQESDLHRNLCNVLADLLRADPRHKAITVGTYHAPSKSEHGRFPDVHAVLEGLPPITLELQLSRTFAPEIAARGSYYNREGVGLIWVFYGLDLNGEELPQSFRDIIRRHRGNVFLFDQQAMQASREAQTLLLWCALKKPDGSFGKPKLVSLDHLQFPAKGLPFLEDRRTPVLIGPAKEARARWFAAIKTIDHHRGSAGYSAPEFSSAYASLWRHVPGLREFRQQLWDEKERPKSHIYAVLAVLFSIARTAHDGQERNLATAHHGKGAMVAMLNTRLHSEEYGHYALLIDAMLRGTAANRLFAAQSLRQHIARAEENYAQVRPGHPMWGAAAWLFPEVLNPLVREELEYIGELPEWAIPS